MITEAHFEAVRELRLAAQALAVACAEVVGPAAFIHEAFDHNVRPPRADERDLLGKLKVVK